MILPPPMKLTHSMHAYTLEMIKKFDAFYKNADAVDSDVHKLVASVVDVGHSMILLGCQENDDTKAKHAIAFSISRGTKHLPEAVLFHLIRAFMQLMMLHGESPVTEQSVRESAADFSAMTRRARAEPSLN